MEIRYVQVMEHASYPEQLHVGTICAEHMEADPLKPRLRETTLVNRAKRRANWLKRKWRLSSKGNPFLNTDGFNIVVFKAGDAYKVRMIHDESGTEIGKRKFFKTEEEAKLKAFDVMMKWKERLITDYH